MSHRTLVTALGTLINHWHRDAEEGELSDADKAYIQSIALGGSYPGTSAVQYIHLDHTTEELGPTNKYNCWGFTFNPRQCWISTGTDVQRILNDNGTQVFVPNVRIGDVICYRNSSGTITHTGRVWSLDGAGNPNVIQSKWGNWGEYYHAPDVVPSIYGTNRTYWRVVPISGKGDAWMKDFAGDDRNAAPPGVDLYISPDLWVNNSGGTFHENPHRHQPNQIWVRLNNPDTLAITNAQVHVFWSDPTGGMPHTDWHLIGTATVSVPAGPGTSAIGGPVVWTPGDAEPEHCCLFAIADTGTDWHAAATLDPIVWPFDVARDNSIVWKNCWIESVGSGSSGVLGPKPLLLDFVAKNPFPVTATLEVRVETRRVGPEEIVRMGLDPALAKRAAVALEAPVKKPGWPLLKRPAPVLGGRPRIGVTVKAGDEWRRSSAGTGGAVLEMARVAPGKGGRLKLEVSALAGARPGEVYRVDLRQKVGGQVTGGGVYIIEVK